MENTIIPELPHMARNAQINNGKQKNFKRNNSYALSLQSGQTYIWKNGKNHISEFDKTTNL